MSYVCKAYVSEGIRTEHHYDVWVNENANDDFWSTYNPNIEMERWTLVKEEVVDLWSEVRDDERLLAIVKDLSQPIQSKDIKREFSVSEILWNVEKMERARKNRSETAKKAAQTRKANKLKREVAKERAKTLVKRKTATA